MKRCLGRPLLSCAMPCANEVIGSSGTFLLSSIGNRADVSSALHFTVTLQQQLQLYSKEDTPHHV